jgi:hypothetical protein
MILVEAAMINVRQRERDEAEKLAREFGVRIDQDASDAMWMLPILQALAKRVKALEDELERYGQRNEQESSHWD